MALGLSGVFSGMDTDSLVTRLMEINRRPLYQLGDRRSEWEAGQKAVTDIEGRLTTLKSLLSEMQDADRLRYVYGSSSDTKILVANTSTGATEGTHQVVVNRLATSQRLVHTAGLAAVTSEAGAEKSTALNVNGAADADATWFTTTANGSTYTFDFGDEDDITAVAFAADTGYSMNQVAALINVRSQAVAGYDAATVEYDSQQGLYFLRTTAKLTTTTENLSQTLTAGDAIDELNEDADWLKTAAGSGQFTYTYNGTTRTLYLASGGTLEHLAELINNDGANPGVTGSLLEYDGSYHMVLSGKDTGEDYTITVDDFYTTLNGFDSGDYTESQAAQDAQIRVDGYPADPSWMERSGNVIDDVLPGVQLNLRTTGTVTVTLNRSTDDLKNKLTNFVDIYNGLVEYIGKYTGYDEDTETGGVLQGDSTINGILSQIRTVLISPAPGFADGEDPYVLAGQIGLKLDRYGQLSIVTTSTDTQTSLDEALSDEYLGTLSLLAANKSGVSDSQYLQFTSSEDVTEAGEYEVEVDFGANGSIQTARIRQSGETAWRFMDIDGSTLVGAAGTAEQGLVLTAVNDGTAGAHTQTASLRIRQGVMGALYDLVKGMLDSTDGLMALKKDRIDAAIEDIDDRIEKMQERLEATEERLRSQFARLEGYLARYDAQRAAVDVMAQQLSTTRKRD
ncbi:MAG TPA: flagellar filament capping protein FliD [Phycisphaerae bacterium]|nr:flagellar filament capping protein FliD [Phycisphaerae bacterium]